MRAVENGHFLRKGEKKEGKKRKGGDGEEGRGRRRPRAFKWCAARSKWSSWGRVVKVGVPGFRRKNGPKKRELFVFKKNGDFFDYLHLFIQLDSPSNNGTLPQASGLANK